MQLRVKGQGGNVAVTAPCSRSLDPAESFRADRCENHATHVSSIQYLSRSRPLDEHILVLEPDFSEAVVRDDVVPRREARAQHVEVRPDGIRCGATRGARIEADRYEQVTPVGRID